MRIIILLLLTLGLIQLQAQSNFQKAEWFVDADPGYHNANQVNFATGNDEAEWAFDLNGLDAGVHYLGVRALDNNGVWSHTLSRSFLVLPPLQPEMVYAEWFIDEDPGFRQANPVPIIGDTAVWEIDLSGLEVGVHYLHVRTQQASGGWTHTLTRSFLVAAEGESPIERIEYRYQDEMNNELSFSYELDEPQHYIDIDFVPDTMGLIGGETYNLCFSVVTIAGVASVERCLEFEAADIPTSIIGANTTAEFRLYPNPTIDKLYIELEPNLEAINWSIIDVQGRYQMKKKLIKNTQQLQIDVAQLPRGIYSLVIESNNMLIVRHFVLK